MFLKKIFCLQRKVTQASERDLKYQTIMRNLVRRYVTQVLLALVITITMRMMMMMMTRLKDNEAFTIVLISGAAQGRE